ncbi:MAG: enoyl-CoA hydratase/isomerase family protein [Acidimicrobiales bacterium]
MSEAVVTERVGNVSIVRLDRPRANALSRAVLAELRQAFDALAADLPGAVVITGTDRIFSAGADIAEFAGPERAGEVSRAFEGALGALADLPRATVAAIAGPALGGGLELALACDFRIAASGARLGQPEVLLGVIPGGGGTQRLARLVGPARAKELIFTGRQLSAAEAAQVGIVDRMVPAGQLMEEAMGLAGQLAAGAVAAQGLAKHAIDRGLEMPLADGVALEREMFVRAFRTHDAEIGVRSFLEHGPGKARFSGG